MATTEGLVMANTMVPIADGEYPLMDESNLKGGYRSVSTEAEMNAIKACNCSEGMLVYVTGTKELYRYEGRGFILAPYPTREMIISGFYLKEQIDAMLSNIRTDITNIDAMIGNIGTAIDKINGEAV